MKGSDSLFRFFGMVYPQHLNSGYRYLVVDSGNKRDFLMFHVKKILKEFPLKELFV